MSTKIFSLPSLQDNYIHLIVQEKMIIAVDPSEFLPPFKFLSSRKSSLQAILITHHHHDHIGGLEPLKNQYPLVQIIGPEDPRIPHVSIFLKHGEKITLGSLEIQAFHVPGHTKSHVLYWLPSQSILFTGDTLFTGGCGKVFEGTFEEMLNSLKLIKTFPKETKIYCGHEYTLKNLKFALSLEENNPDLQARFQETKELREKNLPAVPSLLSLELLTNPFLRTDDPLLKKALSMENASEIEVFTKLRLMKDEF